VGEVSSEACGSGLDPEAFPVLPNAAADTISEHPAAEPARSQHARDELAELAPPHSEDAARQPEASSESPAETAADDSAWRDELSARLNRYRARRKMSPPRYPSLKLKFDSGESLRRTDAPHSSLVSFEPLSDRALALDDMTAPEVTGEHLHPASLPIQSLPIQAPPLTDPSSHSGAQSRAHSGAHSAAHSGAHSGAKIIEFPRFAWAPPPPPLDQLAEPVIDRPRILEAPEVAPPPPALGGITIDPPERPDNEKRPGIDIPLQSAALARRIFATVVDAIIIAAASASFGFVFWKISAIRPPATQTLELAIGIPCLFWSIYQYLLIVYSGSTPGLRAAGLRLARFDGTTTTRSLRRWRVLASYLSAASLGMGYVWVFLDEDSLCWHDRATRTYLAPKRPLQPKGEEPPQA
jgi:uncharacterized RDD family membrane protein YckC